MKKIDSFNYEGFDITVYAEYGECILDGSNVVIEIDAYKFKNREDMDRIISDPVEKRINIRNYVKEPVIFKGKFRKNVDKAIEDSKYSIKKSIDRYHRIENINEGLLDSIGKSS